MPHLLACFARMNPRDLVKAAVFILALAAQSASSTSIFVDAAAPPGGDGDRPRRTLSLRWWTRWLRREPCNARACW
jgi:hypothetical protein